MLIVDRDALAANWRMLAAAAAGAECAAVVKADAYGLGIEVVAPRLWREGCRSFFVALPQEGVALRRLLPDATVAVLGGPVGGACAAFLRDRLVPVLNDAAQIEDWRAATAGGNAPAAILHLDTGMSRLGLGAAELDRLLAEPARLRGLGIDLVMSHLACSDEPDSPTNAAQLRRFRDALARLAPALGKVRASLANSGGILLGADYRFDLVRAGIALYGADPAGREPSRVRPVARLLGRILQVREVPAGATVGYGATYRAAKPARLATVAVGYADGYPRSLGNRGRAVLGGVAVPLVGRVSMDLVTFDVGAAPADAARPGAFVELIGPSVPLAEVAAAAGTIPYEILTGLGPRYWRVAVGG